MLVYLGGVEVAEWVFPTFQLILVGPALVPGRPTQGQVLGSTVEGRCFQSGCWENTEDVGRTLKNKEIRIMYKYFRLCGKPRKGNRK